jgi:hypothetical protein
MPFQKIEDMRFTMGTCADRDTEAELSQGEMSIPFHRLVDPLPLDFLLTSVSVGPCPNHPDLEVIELGARAKGGRIACLSRPAFLMQGPAKTHPSSRLSGA